MNSIRRHRFSRLVSISFAATTFCFSLSLTAFAGNRPGVQNENGGAVIEVGTPRGQSGDAAVSNIEGDTLRYLLQEGDTTFVIKLTSALLDRLKFVNENATAAGRLKISVSNDPLPAASSKWVEVDGNIAFHQKRFFNLSMVGVDARYLRLSFHVEKTARIASVDR